MYLLNNFCCELGSVPRAITKGLAKWWIGSKVEFLEFESVVIYYIEQFQSLIMSVVQSQVKSPTSFQTKSQSVQFQFNHHFEDSPIALNNKQKDMLQYYDNQLLNDEQRQIQIKQKLNQQFFNLRRYRKKKRERYSYSKDVIDPQIAINLQKQMKQSILLTPIRRKVWTSPVVKSYRYDGKQPIFNLTTLPLRTNTKTIMANNKQIKESYFSVELNKIIDKSKSKSKRNTVRNIATLSQRNKQVEKRNRQQKMLIINKVIENQIDNYIKYIKIDKQLSDPIKVRQIIEEKKKKQITNLDVLSVNFETYMRKKTLNKLQDRIYNQKVRYKDTFVEKFQNYILTESKLGDEHKRCLQTIFKNIEDQIKRPSRNRSTITRK